MHDHDHDHDHQDHAATFQADHDTGPATPYEILERAVRELLVEKAILTNSEISSHIDMIATRNAALGAKVTARAWSDPAFRQHYLADTKSALADMDINIDGYAEYRVVENTPDVHNVIVCTLCSCYPKLLLGYPPSWYKSTTYRSRTVREPRAVLTEFGVSIDPATEVRVHDSTADLRYIVLPMRPAGTETWTPDELAAIISRDSLIGTAVPVVPRAE